MLNGSMNYLEGAIEIASLRHDVGAYENDPDFVAFIAVASEADELPIGSSRKYWSEDALKRHETEINKSIEWAKEFSLENCKSLAKRYNA